MYCKYIVCVGYEGMIVLKGNICVWINENILLRKIGFFKSLYYNVIYIMLKFNFFYNISKRYFNLIVVWCFGGVIKSCIYLFSFFKFNLFF